MQISLAKPPTENKQKEKRKQQYRMPFSHPNGRGGGYDDFYLPPYAPGGHMSMPSPIRGASARMNRLSVWARGGSTCRASADYEYDYHGYKDFRDGNYTDDYDGYFCNPEDVHYFGGYSAEPMRRGRGGRGSQASTHRGGYSHYWPPAGSSYNPSWVGRGAPGTHWGARR